MEERLALVRTLLNNRMSIRKTLGYSGCSKSMYYNNKDHVAAATAVTPLSTTTTIEKEIQGISLQRPTYGTR
jgi:hypothetical protein